MWALWLLGCGGEVGCEVVTLGEGCPVEQCCSDTECWLEVDDRRYVCDEPDDQGADCAGAAEEARVAECDSGVPGTTGDTGTTPEPGACPWVGEWAIGAAACGSAPLGVSGGAEVLRTASGCEVRLTLDVEGCTLEEVVYLDLSGPVITSATDGGEGAAYLPDCAPVAEPAALDLAVEAADDTLTLTGALWSIGSVCLAVPSLTLQR